MYISEEAHENQRKILVEYIKEKGAIAQHYDLSDLYEKTAGVSVSKYKWLVCFASAKKIAEYLDYLGVRKSNRKDIEIIIK